MRPDILFSLFTPITSLKGVGPKLTPLFGKLCGDKIADLLWHLPIGLIDRTYMPELRHADKGRVATLKLDVIEHIKPPMKGKPYRIICSDGTDEITLTFFTAKGDYLTKILPLDRTVLVSGNLERFGRGWTMSHPDFIVHENKIDDIPKYEPIYPLTEGLTRKRVHNTVQQALALVPPLPEWCAPELLKREGWKSWKESLVEAHNPTSDKNIIDHKRLAYDEFLADQLALAIIREHHRKAEGRSFKGTQELKNKLLKNLPFTLTDGQTKAIEEIIDDLKEPKRMLRLLQGDVGAGKTIVALFVMLHVIESGSQTALMVPTEILARQHYENLKSLLEPLGIPVKLLIGKTKSKERKETLEALKDGSLPLIVGTHALFQKDVHFNDLGLAVMDEQHRFGVQQRLQLTNKGHGTDILVMTATPIPRTLTLTAYGDMDVSRLMEKPAGRQPIDTRLIDTNRLGDVIDGVGRQIKKGVQAYWVCPLVEESEKIDLAAATERAELLGQHFGKEHVGLIHGKQSTSEKAKVMDDFKRGDIKVLIATTVIEVGVDVPNATLMVIEHSERFGLSQLHQLRGRVGRGSQQSTCLLLYQGPLGEIATARLKTMRETEDGFRIAEEDLKLRGPGEVLGTRQSGLPTYRMADLAQDRDLLSIAHDDAKMILNKDPDLQSERGKNLRILLYLFNKDAAVKLFRSG